MYHMHIYRSQGRIVLTGVIALLQVFLSKRPSVSKNLVYLYAVIITLKNLAMNIPT